LPVDVSEIGCDFYCFSGHKIYGPTGIGVLCANKSLLEKMQPYQYGGDMIESVSLESSTYAKAPAKFEAGTPPIVEIIGLGAALEYVNRIGLDAIRTTEDQLLTEATRKLLKIPGLRIIGSAPAKTSLVSFTLESAHPHDVGTILSQEGIAVRTGHHCAQPVMKRYGVPATTRASFAFYNTPGEIDALIAGLKNAIKVFGS
ncbi:MAG: aminotransferase class V-fold PLP-dependent enzyme, partial [Candidatus Omnitrophota bacterium]